MHRIPTSLAAKIGGEVDDFSAVFSLLDGEAIASATAACAVAWGPDANAANMTAPTSILGNTVTSRVSAGVPGNIYQLRFTATLTSGRVLTNDIWFEVRA